MKPDNIIDVEETCNIVLNPIKKNPSHSLTISNSFNSTDRNYLSDSKDSM